MFRLSGMVSNKSTSLWGCQAKTRQIGSLLGTFQNVSAFNHSTARVNMIGAVMSWPAPDMNRI